MAGLDPYGIQLERGDGQTTETFTAIANITNVEGPDSKRDTYDVTAHDTSDGYREFIGGLVDPGEVKVTLNYDPSEHESLRADLRDSAPRNYKIVYPNSGGQIAVKLLLTELNPKAPVDDKWTADVTFQASGKPTYTSGG